MRIAENAGYDGALTVKKIRAGDELMIQGPTTGVVTLACAGMRIEESPVDSARPGDEITLTVPEPVRRGDTAFVRVPQEGSERDPTAP